MEQDDAKYAVSGLTGRRAFLEKRLERCRKFYAVLLPGAFALGAALTACAFVFLPPWAAGAVLALCLAAIAAAALGFVRERKLWSARYRNVCDIFHLISDMTPGEQERHLVTIAACLRAGVSAEAFTVREDALMLIRQDGEQPLVLRRDAAED